jgi:hypothetical protein
MLRRLIDRLRSTRPEPPAPEIEADIGRQMADAEAAAATQAAIEDLAGRHGGKLDEPEKD